MSKTFYNFITIVSLLSLFHCAYSAAQHRAYLRLIEQPFVSLPADILVQVLISLVVLIYGASYVASPFQHIKRDPNRDKSWDDVASCLSFATFGNRAYAMSPAHAIRQQEPSDLAGQTTSGAVSMWFDTFSTETDQLPDQRRLLGHRSLSTPPKPDFSHLPGARLPRIALSPNKSSPILEISQQQAAEAFHHCFSLVKQHDVDSYLSILALPKKIHPELFAIHALNVELAIIRDKIDSSRGGGGHKDTTGMYRLQFWKDALSSIYGGSTLPVPRQPVAVALCSFAPEATPLRLENLVTARQQTLGDRPFSTVFELCGYGSRTAGSLLQLRVDALARNASLETEMYKEDIEKAASDLGAAFGVLNLIRSSLPLLTRGIVLLPADLLSMNGLSPDLVYNRKREEDVRHVVQQMVQVASSHLESGQRRAQQLPRSIRQAFSSTAIISSNLISAVKKVDYDLYSSLLQRRDALLLAKLLLHKLSGRV